MSKEFDAAEEAKRWVGHARGLDIIRPEHVSFVESSLTGWFHVIYQYGKKSQEALNEHSGKAQGS